jgi:Protein of unknwon function (DUF3310)
MQHNTKTLEESMKNWWDNKDNVPQYTPTEEEKMVMNYIASIQSKLPEDKVNNPSHYTHGGIETIDYLKAKLSKEEFIGFCKGNIFKYLSREALKNGKEDMKKAQWYLNKMIDAV